MKKEEMKKETLDVGDIKLLIQIINTYPVKGTLQNLQGQTDALVKVRNKLMEMMK